jgi:hypothetical protein
MSYIRKYSIILLLLVGSVTATPAQSPVQMIVNMNSMYGAAVNYSMSVNMKFFMGNNDVTPIQSFSGEVFKSSDNYYSSIMGKTTIVNKNCTVFIDDGEKLIVYSKNDHVKKKSKDPMELPDTSLFGKAAKYSFGKGTDACARILIVPGDQSFYKKIEVLINKKTFALEEVVYDYKVEDDPAGSIQKITIQYASVNLNAVIPNDRFSEARFISRQKGKLSGVGKYSAYKVVEQDNTLPTNIH